MCFKCKAPKTVPHFIFVCPNYSTGRNIHRSAVERLGLNFDLKPSYQAMWYIPILFYIHAPSIASFKINVNGYRVILYSLPLCVTMKCVIRNHLKTLLKAFSFSV